MDVRQRTRRWERLVPDVLLVVGAVWAFWGVAYVLNGMTQRGAMVKVPVDLAKPDGPVQWGAGNVQVEVPGVTLPDDAWLSGAGGVLQGGVDSSLTLATWGSTALEQALSRGGTLVVGIAALIIALALRPVLVAVAEGRPFIRGAARRLVLVAVTVGVAGALATALPEVATSLVLERIGLADSEHLVHGVTLGLGTVPIAVLLLMLASAFRTGERNARDLEGLV